MRKPMLAANWKMFKTVTETLGFIEDFVPQAKGVTDAEIVIAPPFTSLYAASAKLRGTNVMLSAQNVYFEEQGAFTGEISPLMLKDIGCSHVIIGHSERRQHFGETDQTVNKKIKTALKAGLKVIFCIGESLDERNTGKTNAVLNRQLAGGLNSVELNDIVIAYEPIWAIGTGVTATPEQAEDAHRFIRSEIEGMHDRNKAEELRILYGGSVKPENIKEIMNCPNIDGALVGGASLKPESFIKIVRYKD